MTLLDKIKEFVSNKPTDKVPDEFCPNCWGKQKYAGEFLEAIKKEKIDLNNLESKRGWIQAYSDKNLSGIKLSGTHKTCKSCTK